MARECCSGCIISCRCLRIFYRDATNPNPGNARTKPWEQAYERLHDNLLLVFFSSSQDHIRISRTAITNFGVSTRRAGFKVRRRPFTASVRPAVLQLRISRYPISHDDRRPMIWLWTSLIGLHPDHDMKNISGNQMPDLYEYDHHAD